MNNTTTLQAFAYYFGQTAEVIEGNEILIGSALATILATGAIYSTPNRSIRALLYRSIKGTSVNTVLMSEARNNNYANIGWLLSNGADPNTRDSSGMTVLMYATSHNNPNAVKKFIAAGADINAADNRGKTPLMYAAEKRLVEIVRIFIDNNVNTDDVDIYDSSALITAFKEPYINVDKLTNTVELLVNAGANVNIVDKFNNTALKMAAEKRTTEPLQLLIRAKAELNNTAGGITALMAAASLGRTENVKLLIDAGAEMNTVNGQSVPALTCAAEKGHPEVAELLLSLGADVNILDRQGRSPLMRIADKFKLEDRHLRVAELLLKHKPQLEKIEPGGRRSTPLLMAAQNNHVDLFFLLIENHANPHTLTTGSNYSILTYAASTGNQRIVDFSLKNNVDVDGKKDDGQTPLMLAAGREHFNIATTLLNAGANVNNADDNGNTPLIYAVMSGDVKTVRLLLCEGAEVNAASKDGNTPLMFAIMHQKWAAFDDLLHEGAEVNVKNTEENTPLMLAAKEGYGNAVDKLLEREADVDVVNENEENAFYLATKYAFNIEEEEMRAEALQIARCLFTPNALISAYDKSQEEEQLPNGMVEFLEKLRNTSAKKA